MFVYIINVCQHSHFQFHIRNKQKVDCWSIMYVNTLPIYVAKLQIGLSSLSILNAIIQVWNLAAQQISTVQWVTEEKHTGLLSAQLCGFSFHSHSAE